MHQRLHRFQSVFLFLSIFENLPHLFYVATPKIDALDDDNQPNDYADSPYYAGEAKIFPCQVEAIVRSNFLQF